MAGPREQTLRETEFDPERTVHEEPGVQRNAAVSSKRQKTEHGHVEKKPGSTRAARPRSGRSGSDSNASNHSRGH